MGLLQNYAVKNAEPLKYISSGISATAAAHRDRSRWNIPSQYINMFATEADNYDGDGKSQLQKAGYPYGYGPPYQFVMPVKSGSMLANLSIVGLGELTSAMVKGGKIAVTITVSGEVSTPNLSLLIPLQALAGKIIGEGNVEGALDCILYMQALAGKIAGQGGIEASMGAIASMIATIIASGGADSSTLRGDAYMASSITVSGDIVTPQSCAEAVWNALAAAYDNEGTMGKALSSAGSAGDPWTGLLASYNDDATFGAFVKKLLTTGKFIALK